MESVAGGVVADASGHGHDAMCSSCPLVVAGKVGAALRFDGMTNVLAVPDAPELDTMFGVTVAAWLWLDALPSTTYYCFLNKPLGTGANDSWQACITTGDATYFGSDLSPTAPTGDDLLDPTPFPGTTWKHIAITWDGTTKQIWIDGMLRTSDSAVLAFDSQPIVIGYDVDNGTPEGALAGILDEVRIYNRALSASELAALAAQ